MVMSVRSFNSNPRAIKAWTICKGLMGMVSALPLEHFVLPQLGASADAESEKSRDGTGPASPTQAKGTIMRPGCTAADEAGQVLFHLQGLSAGWGGTGVLAMDVDRLERAAGGATVAGDVETATALRGFKERLPQVRDPDTAKAAASDFVPIARRAWELGRKCGGRREE